MSEITRINKALLSAVSADETKSEAITGDMAQVRRLAFYVQWGTGVSAGKVVIETAIDPAYAGTWDEIGNSTYSSGAPIVEVIQADGPFMAVRARIDTAVTGGTVSVWVVGN